MTDPVPVFVSIGSNINRHHNIRSGVRAMRDAFGPMTLSRVFESNAVGFTGDNFFNLVAGFDTREDARSIERVLTKIEDEHGRDRSGPRFSPRTLDLDLLLFGDLVQHDGELEVPRDEIGRYAFVLLPLAEIAPSVMHPVSGSTMAELWEAFDKSGQELWPVDFQWEGT